MKALVRISSYSILPAGTALYSRQIIIKSRKIILTMSLVSSLYFASSLLSYIPPGGGCLLEEEEIILVLDMRSGLIAARCEKWCDS